MALYYKVKTLEVAVDKVDLSHGRFTKTSVVAVATACIPFLENDDSNRALDGAKHAASSGAVNSTTLSVGR